MKGVGISFGGVAALDDVSFDMLDGEILGLIGPNGAGKTTLFNCLSRFYSPDRGDIEVNGTSILAKPAHAVAAARVGRTFQNVALFPTMSVRDNVRIGAQVRHPASLVGDVLRLSAARRTDVAIDRAVDEALETLALGPVAALVAGALPFGTQKRVELARALAGEPRLLLLDEPAGGLNHEEVFEFGDLLKRLRTERVLTILLVEHHMGLVMSIADRIVVLNFGRKLAEGRPSEIQADAGVARAYLGGTA